MEWSERGGFLAEYDARFVDSPPAGETDFIFSDIGSGSRAVTVSIEPWDAPAWMGSFRAADPLSRHTASLVSATPNPTRMCVVERGTPFLVNVLRPSEWTVVRLNGPVMRVSELVAQELLLLTTPWSITAVGVDGPLWSTARIAAEEIRIDEVEAGWLRGVADPRVEEPREFAIDLRSGEVVGGIGGR